DVGVGVPGCAGSGLIRTMAAAYAPRRLRVRHRGVEVMLVTYVPQRSDRVLTYVFPAPDVIEATLDGVTDRFDFSGLPDGELDVSALETTLPICPVLAARRVNGKLEVTLLRFHGPN